MYMYMYIIVSYGNWNTMHVIVPSLVVQYVPRLAGHYADRLVVTTDACTILCMILLVASLMKCQLHPNPALTRLIDESTAEKEAPKEREGVRDFRGKM